MGGAQVGVTRIYRGDFTVWRDAHGDLLLRCPKGCNVAAESGVSLRDLWLEAVPDHLRDIHRQGAS